MDAKTKQVLEAMHGTIECLTAMVLTQNGTLTAILLQLEKLGESIKLIRSEPGPLEARVSPAE